MMPGVRRRARSCLELVASQRVVPAVTAIAMNGCIVHTLPPPPAPAKDMPVVNVPPTPPRPGFSRVLIATDVPARVALTGEQPSGPTAGPRAGFETTSCEDTPCVLTLPKGEHEFQFEGTRKHSNRRGTANVVVRNDTVVVNHALGKEETSSELVYGLACLGAAAAFLVTPLTPLGQEQSETGRTIDLVAGGVFTVVGAFLLGFSSKTRQAGATTQWTPSPKPEPARAGGAVSFGRTF